jgi:hypothetical protein
MRIPKQFIDDVTGSRAGRVDLLRSDIGRPALSEGAA